MRAGGRWLVTLLVCIAAVQAGDNDEIPPDAVPIGKRLDTLVIEGLLLRTPAMVRNAAGLTTGMTFGAADVQEAVKSLYRLGLFRSIDIFILEESPQSASLLLRVEEYPVCDDVSYSGIKRLKAKDFEDVVSIRPGRVLSSQSIHENILAIRKKYADEGHLQAEIEAEVRESRVPGNASIRFSIDEGLKVRIRSIEFEGNEAFKPVRLRRKFKTKEDRWWRSGKFEEYTYREHIDSLLMYYHNQGYLDARVAQDSVWYAPNMRDIHIVVQLDEGKRYYAGNFYFEGNTILSADTLEQKVALKYGRPFEQDKFSLSKHFIEDAYREEGYLWVQLRDERAFRGDTIDVTMRITEGRAAIVRKIDIAGNTKTRDKVIRRHIVLNPSQKYRQSRMARSVREIMQTNYFNNVTPDLRPNADGTIDLLFKVEEKDNIGQLSIGAAYSERDRFVGTFSTSIPNFRGSGQELNLNVEYGKYRQDYSIGFREPWAFNRPISISTSVFYNFSKYATWAGSSESYGFRLGGGRRLKWPDDYWRADGMYLFSWTRESLTEQRDTADVPILVPHEGFTSRLSFTLYRNDFDFPQFPTRGSSFYITPEVAGLGGKYQHLKTTLGYDWYFPVLWKLVFGLRTKFGLVSKLPWAEELVISRWDLYNAGGVYSDGTIRGYPEYTFGGRSDPSEGITMLVATAMLQFPVMDRQLYLSIFGDMGNTWSSVSKIDPMDMYKGVGFGVRLMIPMLGLLGFDFAWKLDDPNRTAFTNDPGDRFELHFLLNRGF